MPALAVKYGAEAREITGLRILLDGARDPFDGKLMEPLFEAQQAHEMQSVCMTRVERQRLLTTDLRIEVSTGLQKAVAGF